MGKGEGAVDKNMRKELSLEIDGHACPDQYVNVGIGAEIKCRAPHAIDAMSTQLTGRFPRRTSRRSSSKKLLIYSKNSIKINQGILMRRNCAR